MDNYDSSDTTVFNDPLNKGNDMTPSNKFGLKDNLESSDYDFENLLKSLNIGLTEKINHRSKKKESSKKEPKILKEELKVEVELLGQPFFLMQKEGEIHLKHKVWSLSGFGKTNAEAFDSLKENGKILLSAYRDFDREELDEDAQEMVEFLKLTFGDG